MSELKIYEHPNIAYEYCTHERLACILMLLMRVSK